MQLRKWVEPLKRLFDVVVAVLALTLLALPLLGLMGLIRLKLGSPVLFRQTRPGLGGLPFELIKFRTMTDDRDVEGVLLPDAERLTSFGRLLRATSLDELPELWNVLRGDMSLVGPRPLLMRYLPYYTDRERRRHGVRPGLTGWAQLHGRNTVSWDERLALDVWYVENRTLALDFRILLQTVVIVLKREGVVIDPGAAMKDLDVERGADARRDPLCR